MKRQALSNRASASCSWQNSEKLQSRSSSFITTESEKYNSVSFFRVYTEGSCGPDIRVYSTADLFKTARVFIVNFIYCGFNSTAERFQQKLFALSLSINAHCIATSAKWKTARRRRPQEREPRKFDLLCGGFLFAKSLLIKRSEGL
jgi:hypothetical protein